MIKEKKCFFCGHGINEHDFSHKLECRHKDCDCEEFIFETRKCSLCDKIIDRKNLSELMLNPQIQLIDLCEIHFDYKLKGYMLNPSLPKPIKNRTEGYPYP